MIQTDVHTQDCSRLLHVAFWQRNKMFVAACRRTIDALGPYTHWLQVGMTKKLLALACKLPPAIIATFLRRLASQDRAYHWDKHRYRTMVPTAAAATAEVQGGTFDGLPTVWL